MSECLTELCKVGQLTQWPSINNTSFSGNQSTRHITSRGDVRLEKEEAERTKEDTTSAPTTSHTLAAPYLDTNQTQTHTHTQPQFGKHWLI